MCPRKSEKGLVSTLLSPQAIQYEFRSECSPYLLSNTPIQTCTARMDTGQETPENAYRGVGEVLWRHSAHRGREAQRFVLPRARTAVAGSRRHADGVLHIGHVTLQRLQKWEGERTTSCSGLDFVGGDTLGRAEETFCPRMMCVLRAASAALPLAANGDRANRKMIRL